MHGLFLVIMFLTSGSVAFGSHPVVTLAKEVPFLVERHFRDVYGQLQEQTEERKNQYKRAHIRIPSQERNQEISLALLKTQVAGGKIVPVSREQMQQIDKQMEELITVANKLAKIKVTEIIALSNEQREKKSVVKMVYDRASLKHYRDQLEKFNQKKEDLKNNIQCLKQSPGPQKGSLFSFFFRQKPDSRLKQAEIAFDQNQMQNLRVLKDAIDGGPEFLKKRRFGFFPAMHYSLKEWVNTAFFPAGLVNRDQWSQMDARRSEKELNLLVGSNFTVHEAVEYENDIQHVSLQAQKLRLANPEKKTDVSKSPDLAILGFHPNALTVSNFTRSIGDLFAQNHDTGVWPRLNTDDLHSFGNRVVDIHTFAYQGYQQSSGFQSPQNAAQDGITMIKHVLATSGPTTPVVLYGFSIGGPVMLTALGEFIKWSEENPDEFQAWCSRNGLDPSTVKDRVKVITLRSTFDSYAQMAASYVGRFVPIFGSVLGPILGDRFAEKRWVPHRSLMRKFPVDLQVLSLQNKADLVVSYRMSESVTRNFLGQKVVSRTHDSQRDGLLKGDSHMVISEDHRRLIRDSWLSLAKAQGGAQKTPFKSNFNER
jgi:hypothetical protein